jgi:hypothetical protein
VTKGPVNVNSPVSLGEVVKQEVEDPSFLLQDGHPTRGHAGQGSAETGA